MEHRIGDDQMPAIDWDNLTEFNLVTEQHDGYLVNNNVVTITTWDIRRPEERGYWGANLASTFNMDLKSLSKAVNNFGYAETINMIESHEHVYRKIKTILHINKKFIREDIEEGSFNRIPLNVRLDYPNRLDREQSLN